VAHPSRITGPPDLATSLRRPPTAALPTQLRAPGASSGPAPAVPNFPQQPGGLTTYGTYGTCR
jgi:hypothetical protein